MADSSGGFEAVDGEGLVGFWVGVAVLAATCEGVTLMVPWMGVAGWFDDLGEVAFLGGVGAGGSFLGWLSDLLLAIYSLVYAAVVPWLGIQLRVR